MKPSILFVDEPSIGLEPRYIDMVFEILIDLQKGENKTIILVEQNIKKDWSLLIQAMYWFQVRLRSQALEMNCSKILMQDVCFQEVEGVAEVLKLLGSKQSKSNFKDISQSQKPPQPEEECRKAVATVQVADHAFPRMSVPTTVKR